MSNNNVSMSNNVSISNKTISMNNKTIGINSLVYVPNGKYKGHILKITGINESSNKPYNTEETNYEGVIQVSNNLIGSVSAKKSTNSPSISEKNSRNSSKLFLYEPIKNEIFYSDNSSYSLNKKRVYFKHTGVRSTKNGTTEYEFKITDKTYNNGKPNFSKISGFGSMLNRNEIKKFIKM